MSYCAMGSASAKPTARRVLLFRREPPATSGAGGSCLIFRYFLVEDGNRAISGAVCDDRGLHAAIGCYVIYGPAQ
jgi:hypothetical protein